MISRTLPRGILAGLLLAALTAPASGQTVTCRPNIFGGQDCDTPAGPITSQPNIFGGQDYTLPDGRRVTSQPNIFGGHDYQSDDADRAPVEPVTPDVR